MGVFNWGKEREVEEGEPREEEREEGALGLVLAMEEISLFDGEIECRELFWILLGMILEGLFEMDCCV